MPGLISSLKLPIFIVLLSVSFIIVTNIIRLKDITIRNGNTDINHLKVKQLDDNVITRSAPPRLDDDVITTSAPPQTYAQRQIKTKSMYPITAILSNPYLINNKYICRGVTKVSCLVMVHTAPNHSWRRSEMRRTWLNSLHYSPENVRVIFLLGTVSNPETQASIMNESRHYNDIIQGKFFDSYQNLTLKGVLGFRWITENCMNADIVLKVDDDVLINFFKFFEEMKSKLVKRKKFIYCSKNHPYRMSIIRRNDSFYGKWFVLPDEFRSYDYYPHTYCSGFCVFISTDLVPALYHAAKASPFFWIDDVYLFGILPSQIKDITFESFYNYFTLRYTEAIKCYKQNKENCHYAIMSARDEELDIMWKAVITGKIRSQYGYYYMKLQDK